MKLWRKEFEEERDSRVSQVIFDRWTKNPRYAQVFVMGSRKFRLDHVAEIEAEIARKDECSAGREPAQASAQSTSLEELVGGEVSEERVRAIEEAIRRYREGQS